MDCYNTRRQYAFEMYFIAHMHSRLCHVLDQANSSIINITAAIIVQCAICSLEPELTKMCPLMGIMFPATCTKYSDLH